MKKQVIAILSLIILFTTSITAYATSNLDAPKEDVWPEGPNVYAESAIVMEASSGLVLYEKNMNDVNYPASITKIMTCLLAIENSSLGDIVTFSKDAIFNVDMDSSRIGIDVGEQLTMQQCLYAILLESDNVAAYAVAEHISGNITAFADLMNEKAKSIGCLNTNFTNPNGLPDDAHVTSAYDMALITRAAMTNETFRKITSARTYQIPPTNLQSEIRYLRNHHRFVLKQDYFYDDCIGGKTGYTEKARYTLVSIAKRGDLELICVVMRDDTNEHQYTDSQKLLDFGFDNFSIYNIADLESSAVVQESPLFTKFNPLLSQTETPFITDENGYIVLPNTASFEDAKKDITFLPISELTEGGNVIGTISYTYNSKYVGGVDIVYNNIENLSLTKGEKSPGEQVVEEEIPDQLKSTGDLRPIIIGVIIGFIVLLFGLYYAFVERPRLKRKSAYYKKKQNRKSFLDNDHINYK